MQTNRRGFLIRSVAIFFTLFLRVGRLKADTAVVQALKKKQPREIRFAEFVNLDIGTAAGGNTFPGATVPFGAVQLSPDTFSVGSNICSGYMYADNTILGFSHTHLSGAGCNDLADFLLMPYTGEVKLEAGAADKNKTAFSSRFSHDEEIKEPGYYSVMLQRFKIRAELTATQRSGMHRYTFPSAESRNLLFDLSHSFSGESGLAWSQVIMHDERTILGGRATNEWAKGREIYFAMQFSKPYSSFEIFEGEQKLDNSPAQFKGKFLKCLFHFAKGNDPAIQVKVGISSVSALAAMKNLGMESPNWNFDDVAAKARQAWERELSRIQIDTQDRKKKEIFYSALYHSLLAPTVFDDVDGNYLGMDGKVHLLPPGQGNYSAFSLWDTFRAVHPLFTLIQPKRAADFVNCLIRMAHESPSGMPVWPLYGKETACMTGYHSAVVIAEACVKKIPGVDYAAAYAPMRQRAFNDDYRGLAAYRKFNYIPADIEQESVSKTLEYCYDDWAIAHVADAVGSSNDANFLLKRSANYKNLFDTNQKFIRGKLESGAWAEPFDPIAMGHMAKWPDYTEANSWQTTFGILHDPRGLIELMGGNAPFIEKLDSLFKQDSALPNNAPGDITGMVGQYAHGNEPSHHIAYLYAYAQAPHKTQERVQSLMATMYNNTPDGLAGNDDCGQMSAWFIMSSLGFYSVDPVSGNYVFGSPLFNHAKLDLGRGKHLIVEAVRSTAEEIYIQSITFNGLAFNRIWFNHAEIANGGHFILHMGSKPNFEFGSGQDAAPPSGKPAFSAASGTG